MPIYLIISLNIVFYDGINDCTLFVDIIGVEYACIGFLTFYFIYINKNG